MKAIDMRLRPPYKSYRDNLYDGMAGMEAMAAKRRVHVAESARQMSMSLLIEEMEASDVVGVAPVRKIAQGKNDDMVDLLKDYPDRFIGIANIDPLNPQEAFDEIDRYVVHGPASGVIIEHAWSANREHWFVNDPRAYAVYERLEQHNIPVLFSFGGRGVKNQEYYNPKYIDELAFTFPRLKMALCHGGWPFVIQACHAAVQHSNVYLSPDVYMMRFTAGYQDYVTAANYQLQDKMMFGTAYPVMSLQDGIDQFTSLLDPSVVEKVLYQNALEFFSDSAVTSSATGH